MVVMTLMLVSMFMVVITLMLVSMFMVVMTLMLVSMFMVVMALMFVMVFVIMRMPVIVTAAGTVRAMIMAVFLLMPAHLFFHHLFLQRIHMFHGLQYLCAV